MAGLLIINADDWGHDVETTDAIARVFELGSITSASAMVFMADSERAAEQARAVGLPTGLHLNLTEPYSGDGVPDGVRERQLRLAEHVTGGRLARWTWSRPAAALVREVAADQIARYGELYGRPPAHVDGHLHMHLAPAVLLSGALAGVASVRPSFTFRPADKPLPNRLLRGVLNVYLRRRFTTARHFFSIRTIHPRLGGRGLDEALAISGESSVEVMTHPGWKDELELLRQPDWRATIASHPLGSYGELGVRG